MPVELQQSIPDVPYLPYRTALYDPAELMAGYRRGEPSSYVETTDQKIYAHFDRLRRSDGPVAVGEALAQRLHDHAIDCALSELLHNDGDPRRVVAIMGGHSMKRTDAAYRDVARISRALAERGFLMASGGGPGAMEATHLGAALAASDDVGIDTILTTLSRAPYYTDEAWHDTALDALDDLGELSVSLGIPTWFYGHEPSNLFATHIAKYFSNSIREDGLLAIAKHGVIYSPGSAGTIQEVFMDACQNHYGTFEMVSPMVFLDRVYWTETKPVYPLLRELAQGRQYADLLTAVDEVDEAVEFLTSHPPVKYGT
jgi:predicted Rossmann-fold nucleotide-binding protein